MGRMKGRPRYNVVSMRVSDDEWEVLQELSRMRRKNVSQVLREAMHQLYPAYDELSRPVKLELG